MAQRKSKTPGIGIDNEGLEVGYRRPPKATQFKKGKSGNPKGRPKGSPNTKGVYDKVLGASIKVQQGGKTLTISKLEGVVMGVANDALKGDPRARSEILKRVKIDDVAEQLPPREQILREDREIFERLVARIRGEAVEDLGVEDGPDAQKREMMK